MNLFTDPKYDWFFDLVLLPICLYAGYNALTKPRRRRR